MKTALVCGAGGFIGGNMVKKLQKEGYWVRGVDEQTPEFTASTADEFLLLDLRRPENCGRALMLKGGTFDEVYQLAANFGGMGYITGHECEIVHDNTLIDTNMVHAAARLGVGRYFFSSSACVYRDMGPGEAMLTEDDAYPAYPDNEYGWEKLYAERMLQTYGRHYDMVMRIGRYDSVYGIYSYWCDGREKVIPAICRKVAMAEDGDTIEVWGDGTAVRSFIWVGDVVDATYTLMQSDVETPTNICTGEYVTVNEVVDMVIAVSGKDIQKKHVAGIIGVQSRDFCHARIKGLGWEPKMYLSEGIGHVYRWIEAMVKDGKITEHT